jgi:hypothetical protein
MKAGNTADKLQKSSKPFDRIMRKALQARPKTQKPRRPIKTARKKRRAHK